MTGKTQSALYLGILILFAVFIVVAILVTNPFHVVNPEFTQNWRSTETPNTESTPTREFTGTVVSVSENGEYVRVSIPGEGIFSVGLSDDSVVLDEGKTSSLLVAEPLSKITIVAAVSPATSRYDYVIQTADISKEKPKEEMTIEERINRFEGAGAVTGQ